MTPRPPILAYAPPGKRPIGRYIGVSAAVATVVGSCLIVATTLTLRYALTSDPGCGRCGTSRATLREGLVTLPAMLFVATLIAAAVADYQRAGPVACRVALAVAVLGWVVCAFVG